ncbi:hypothetical protein EV401DRAFT_1925409 [Pisolithus croceorrhizus]|nr:hypothetical protein EV401DRAFT_1925409 [Pisolithus croceorrhizus]
MLPCRFQYLASALSLSFSTTPPLGFKKRSKLHVSGCPQLRLPVRSSEGGVEQTNYTAVLLAVFRSNHWLCHSLDRSSVGIIRLHTSLRCLHLFGGCYTSH